MEDLIDVNVNVVSNLVVGLRLKAKDVEFIKAYNEKEITLKTDDEQYNKIVNEIEKQMGIPFDFNSNKNDRMVIDGIYEENGNVLFE